MEVEWQTLLKNQAAKVLSLEETTQARARWSDRAMDTRWARTWKPDDSKPSAPCEGTGHHQGFHRP